MSSPCQEYLYIIGTCDPCACSVFLQGALSNHDTEVLLPLEVFGAQLCRASLPSPEEQLDVIIAVPA